MSAVPPSCYDSVGPSGTPVRWGGCTILTNHPTHAYFHDKVITWETSGTGVPGYFQHLDTEFVAVPSGWSTGGYGTGQ